MFDPLAKYGYVDAMTSLTRAFTEILEQKKRALEKAQAREDRLRKEREDREMELIQLAQQAEIAQKQLEQRGREFEWGKEKYIKYQWPLEERRVRVMERGKPPTVIRYEGLVGRGERPPSKTSLASRIQSALNRIQTNIGQDAARALLKGESVDIEAIPPIAPWFNKSLGTTEDIPTDADKLQLTQLKNLLAIYKTHYGPYPIPTEKPTYGPPKELKPTRTPSGEIKTSRTRKLPSPSVLKQRVRDIWNTSKNEAEAKSKITRLARQLGMSLDEFTDYILK